VRKQFSETNYYKEERASEMDNEMAKIGMVMLIPGFLVILLIASWFRQFTNERKLKDAKRKLLEYIRVVQAEKAVLLTSPSQQVRELVEESDQDFVKYAEHLSEWGEPL